MLIDLHTIGSNPSSLGYRSIGLIVPEVRMIDGKYLMSGLKQREESRQESVRRGSDRCPSIGCG